MSSSWSTGCPWWSEERLRAALIANDGNKTAVAREFGTTYETIKEWTERHELEDLAWNPEDGYHPTLSQAEVRG